MCCQALELCESPGGDDLLGMISYVYNAKGKQNMGRYGGFEGFFSGIKDKGHMVGQGIGLFKHFFNIHKVQQSKQAKCLGTDLIDVCKFPD